MTTTNNISEITSKVNGMIESVRNGAASQYFSFYLNEEDEESWTIRVSNHNANPARVDEKTIVFVVVVEEDEDEEEMYSSLSINKKSFRSIPNQYVLDADNENENGEGVEEILEYHLS